MARDLVWDGMFTVAERLTRRAQRDDRVDAKERIQVAAKRKRSLLSLTVTEGLEFGNLWTDGFEPVRERRLLRRNWREVQNVAEAASKVGEFIRSRPDLGLEESGTAPAD